MLYNANLWTTSSFSLECRSCSPNIKQYLPKDFYITLLMPCVVAANRFPLQSTLSGERMTICLYSTAHILGAQKIRTETNATAVSLVHRF